METKDLISEINNIVENDGIRISGNYIKNKQEFNRGFITVELTNEFKTHFILNDQIEDAQIEG